MFHEHLKTRFIAALIVPGLLAACSPQTSSAAAAAAPQTATAPVPAAAVAPPGTPLVRGLPDFANLVEQVGPAVVSVPGQNGTGQTLSGFLESSNVDPVKELVTLIQTQRSFELNSQSIQTADEALQVIGNMKKS